MMLTVLCFVDRYSFILWRDIEWNLTGLLHNGAVSCSSFTLFSIQWFCMKTRRALKMFAYEMQMIKHEL